MTWIPFNKPFLTGRELDYVRQAHENHHLSGDGPFTRRCHAWLERRTGCGKALLTHSCTGALDMAAILAGIEPGDEVIMPSFTFVSTANAFVLRGGVPVFVDIREDTLNIDERLIEAAITPRTKAIVVVHYAGVACAMDAIGDLARRRGLVLIEDAAQALGAAYRGKPLGSFGELAAISFHETKNVISGEGGALLINDARLAARAEIIREKGTNRSQFFRGEIDKYTWVDVGSSFLPSDILAAFLWAQLEAADAIQARRQAIWQRYQDGFAEIERAGRARRPVVLPETTPNAHCYFLLLADAAERPRFIERLRRDGVHAVFHYVPLHSSPAGRKFGRASGSMSVTDAISDRLVRLPLWIGLEAHQEHVIERCRHALA
ncbi:MAG: dTDP-4-amino-4,6-dideoxygalactose transaminase [Betaproteobacteria bacterium]|nr:dTDP-4-amino-4,6-dideoxygalactose transaminase [Betaproteobacteria bacterium]MBV9361624.1 dTDP-4-amino-4,6-dideoxygalactose transaminase [Betaproteobacteria bacterium]